MAGLGRRTHYRKHLTDSVLHDLPEPNPPHSQIAKIVATRGSNQFDVMLTKGRLELAILPTKFRKLVWLKRNDFVIVETVESQEEETGGGGGDDDDGIDGADGSNHDNNQTSTAQNDSGGIRCMISHILYQDQIKHLIGKGLWPMEDPEFSVDDRKRMDTAGNQQPPRASEDGIVYGEAYLPPPRDDGDCDDEYASEEGETPVADDPLLFVNTNRLARLTVQDSSSDEDD